MDSSRPKYETWLYAIAFLLALGLRVARLGAFPLTDAEAVPALQALQIARGTPSLIGPNSAYALLTGLLFFVTESSNFLARFVPALAGAFLVFLPLLFKRQLGPLPAALLAVFLAVDPGLLALSRQAGSAILAVAFLLFAWGFWERGSWITAGILAALAALSGPAVWAGVLGLALTWAILQSMERGGASKEAKEEDLPEAGEASAPEVPAQRPAWRTALTAFAVTLVLFGTVIFLVPGGLNGALDALVQYIRGWVVPSSVPGRLVFFSLFLYQPLTVLLALVGLVRGLIAGDRLTIRLAVWMLVALLLAVFYPSHQVHDVVWALVPLSALAALELSRHVEVEAQERLEVGGVALLTVLVLAFAWLDLANLPWSAGNQSQTNLRIWLFFGALFLLVVSLLLVAVGWSARTARLGAVWGVTFFLTLFMVSGALAAGRLRDGYTSELWDAGPYPVHAGLLEASVSDLSQWGKGEVDAVPVIIFPNDLPAARWALRSRSVSVVNSLDPAAAPPILVTPFIENPAVGAAYRGQDFSWNQSPNWAAALPGDWLKWVTQREMPQSYETIMLWVRDDLFLDSPSRQLP